MSLARVHNFSISLDGFATGEGLTADAPFGHAGHRLHEWMMATRFGRPIIGESGGTDGVDNAMAERRLGGKPLAGGEAVQRDREVVDASERHGGS